MFEAKSVIFIYVETPLHAGTSRGFSGVDLPIQREKITEYPMIQSSGIKGKLRAVAEIAINTKGSLTNDQIAAVFGPDTSNAAAHGGALSVGDARLVLFPVRSLFGVFAWTTSVDALCRFYRDASQLGLSLGDEFDLSEVKKDKAQALVAPENSISDENEIVLEEFNFGTIKDEKVAKVGEWFASNALPQTDEYKYWLTTLPQKLCILPEDSFRDFTRFSTEVQTHIKLDTKTKTVDDKALWTTESLPMDSLLYSPLMATPSRDPNQKLSGKEILDLVISFVDNNLSRIQLGGNETTGQGISALRISGGAK